MHSSKHISNIIQVLLLLAILMAVEIAAANMLVDANYSHYFKYDVDEIARKGEDVEMIFMGASRTYRTFIPEIFEDRLEFNNVLNAGSSSQTIYGSYYQLKYLLRKFHPKYVVLCVTWDEMLPNDSINALQSNLLVADRMPFIDKLEFGLDCFRKDLLYLSYLYRFREHLHDKNILETGRTRYLTLRAIREGTMETDTSGTEFYADKGFVYNRDSNATGSFRIETLSYDKDGLIQERIKYLDKISNLCERKGVKLYFATGPTTMERIYSIQNYQEAVDFYEKYAKEHNTQYFNLNYLIGREKFLPDELMHDLNHVNGDGAEVVSEIFAEILDKDFKGEDTSGYFYSSVSELKKEVDRIVSVGADISIENNVASVTAYCLANEDIIPEYRISVSENGKRYIPITDFETDAKYVIDISAYESCVFKIEARRQGAETIDACQEALIPVVVSSGS